MRMRLFLAAVLGLFLSASVTSAQPADAKLPDGLRHVPLDATGFVHIRTGEFLRSDLGKQLMLELLQDKEASRGLKKTEQELGIALADVESVTLLMLSMPARSPFGPGSFPRRPPMYDKKALNFDMPVPKVIFEKREIEDKKPEPKPDAGKESPVVFQPGVLPFPFPGQPDDRLLQPEFDDFAMQMAFSGPLVIVTSAKPLERKKILQAQLFHGRQNENLYQVAFEPSVVFLSDRSVMIGAAWELARYSERMARNPGPKATPMKTALALAAEPHLVVAGGHMPPELRRLLFMPYGDGPDMRALATIAPLLQAEGALAVDLGKSLNVTMQFNAATETSAEQALQAAKSLRVLAELAIENANEAGEPGGWKLNLQKRLKDALAGATIEQKGTTVKAQLALELDSTLVKRYTKEIVSAVRQRGGRTQSVNNLKQIGLALHNYHDANKRFPPAGVSSINDPNGKPLLSWRVAILPYIDQGQLYQQFDLTQPWDHPTNKKLIAKMPSIYVVPGTENKEGETNYRVLVGPGAMFELQPGNRGIQIQTITDGTSNTIMAVEAAEPTIWTRPDDLPFDPKGPLPKFGTSPDGFNVLMGDGTVRFLRANTPENVLRAMITRNGGEVIELPNDR